MVILLKRAVDRLLAQVKVDQSDATMHADYVEACTNVPVTFHDQKGLSLAKLSDMKKAWFWPTCMSSAFAASLR